jgi:uncharacterized protein
VASAIIKLDPVWIPLADGTRLAATIWRPRNAEAEPVPAILEYVPYRRRDFTAVGDSLTHPWLAAQGYACVRVDLRGSGDSDGILEDEYLPQELADGVEVIAWLAGQPWCTGRVGMMGISWGGFNALQVAALRPPALEAILTLCSTDDRYADDIHTMGGCLLSENLMWASTMFAFNSRPPDPEVVGERWRAMWRERLELLELLKPWIGRWPTHQRRDAFWRHGSVCEDFAAIECAVYAVGGWADAYTNAIPRLLAGLSCPRKGLIGPWSHAWPHKPAWPGPAIGFLQEALRWWDHWLKDRDTGIMDEPMLRAWMQESVPPRPHYLERPGRWVAEEAWPSPEITIRHLALNPGRIEDEAAPPAQLRHRSSPTVGLAGGEWCPYGFEAEMPLDQRGDDGGSLAFESEPLPERLEILGAPVVELELAVDRPRAFIAVRLSEVHPAGEATRVSYGLLNLTHRDGHERPHPLEPGRRYRVRVPLCHIAHAFPEGHRLRLAISTSYWPLVWPSPEPVTLTLFTGTSGLELPVRPPRAEDEELPPFAPAVTPDPLPHSVLVPYHRSRRVSHDLGRGETVVLAVKDRGRIHLHETGLTYAGRGEERYSLKGDDPLSARAETRYEISLERGEWRVRTETRTVLTSTADEFVVSASLEAFEGEVRTLARTFTARMPRDHL